MDNKGQKSLRENELRVKESRDKCAERLKALCAENGISQKELAEKAGIHQNTVSKIAKGRTTMSDEIAGLISQAFPSYRAEYLMGKDDYKTDNDFFDSVIAKRTELYEKKVSAMNALLSPRGFEICLYSSGMVIGPGGGYEDEYVIRRGSTQMVACYSDLMTWFEDIADYSEMKFNRLLKECGGGGNG